MLLNVTLGDIETDLISASNDMFTYIMDMVKNLLTTNPKDWAVANEIWSIIENINNIVVIVACQLVVLFFLIGFVEESNNIREDLSLEKIFKLLFKIAITQYFVVNSLDIIGKLFEITTRLTGITSFVNYNIGLSGIWDHIYEMADISRVVFLFPTILYLIIVPACSAGILCMALMRLFKIYLAVPYGSLAFSAMASGSKHMENIPPGFVKYMLSILLEAFTLSLALSIGFRLMISQHGFVDLSNVEFEGHFIPATLLLVGAIINVALLTILCKMSQNVATRALSLDRP